MKVYLAGPMTGIKAFNIPAFDSAAAELRSRGYEVISPAEIDGPVSREVLMASEHGSHDDLPKTESYGFYLGRDMQIIVDEKPDGIVTLPGWKNSTGAKLEVALCENLGIRQVEYVDLITTYDQHAEKIKEQLGVNEPLVSEETITTPDGREVDVTRFGPPSRNQARYEEDFVPYEENPERQRAISGAVKDNRSKSRVDLIPAVALEKVGEVMGYGARKYKAHNWRLGLSWSQTMGSILRHLYAFSEGEDADPETGISHVAHAACQVLFLLTYVIEGSGEDDRFVSISKEDAAA